MEEQPEVIQTVIQKLKVGLEDDDQTRYQNSFRKLAEDFENLKTSGNSFEDFTESCVELFYSEEIMGYPDELFRGGQRMKINESLKELYRDLKTKFCELTKKMDTPTSATIDLVIQGMLNQVVTLIPNITFIAGLYVTAACYYWMKAGVANFCG